MDESEDTLLLSFLDIVCAALGAAVTLFVLFLDIGSFVPAQTIGGRFLMGDFEVHPAQVDYRLEILAPNGNRIRLVREDLESPSAGAELARVFGESGTPAIFTFRSKNQNARFINVNIGEPWPGCWRFRLAYLSPKQNATYREERPVGNVDFKWATHHQDKFGQPMILTPDFASEQSLVAGSIPVDISPDACR